MMAPNALPPDVLHEQDTSAFHAYSPEHYSDSELDGGRGKGANGKPRTRLGYQRISIACLYCRRRKIRCLPPVGEGDRCQNCARQQRECVVQPIAGSTRKGGRNQGNAMSTDPMPYAEALSMTRNAHSSTLAHRRSAKSPSERHYDHGYFPPNPISIPSYPYSGPSSAGVPFSAPPHFTSPNVFPPSHYTPDQTSYNQDNTRRPAFKHVQTAPVGGVYTIHHSALERPSGQQSRPQTSQESYPGQWQATPGPPHYAGTTQEVYHPANQDLSADPSTSFWRLGGGNITSPAPTEISLPPPRPQNQWVPTLGNYTHERPASSTITLPAPNNSHLGETPPFQSQYYPPSINTSVGNSMSFASSTTQTSGSSQSQEDHCETNGHWSRPTSGYRSTGSI